MKHRKPFITYTCSADKVEEALHQHDQLDYDLIGSTMVKPEKTYMEPSFRTFPATILLMFKARPTTPWNY